MPDSGDTRTAHSNETRAGASGGGQASDPGAEVGPATIQTRALIDLWRAGDEGAARQIFDRYVDRLVALARRRISQRLASRVDPEDVVQSVFRTFFVRVKAGQFCIEHQDDLTKLLVRITVHKTLRQVEYHQAAKRSTSQETVQGNLTHDRLTEMLDREPTPAEANSFLDQLEHFLNRLQPFERQVLELRMQGYSNEEIAKQLGTYDRKIRRVMERVRGQAEKDILG
jgi:RNA polymerase sigma-70 factor (ECF subfamily)